MRTRTRRSGIVSLVSGTTLALLLGACSLIEGTIHTPARPVGVEVSNATTLPITIVVNGAIVRNIGPGDGTQEPMTSDVLGPMPWHVEAWTASGRVLLTLTVHEGDVIFGADSSQGVAQRVDLSCGRLDVWAGPPLSGPAPGPGVPGDCIP